MSPVKSPEEPGARDTRKKDKIVVDKDEAEELLPGWTKEVKVRKAGSGTKVDRYYTDPVTGYTFRSLKDVQRYLKTGEVGRLAIKPKNDDSVNTDNRDENLHMKEKEETSELKEQKSDSWRHKRPLEDGSNGSKRTSRSSDTDRSPYRASKRLVGTSIDASLPPPSPPEPKTRQATRLAGVAVDASLPLQSSPEPKTHQATRLAGVAVDASLPLQSSPEPKTRQATRLAGVVVDASLPLQSSPEPKTRPATRLEGVVVDASLPSPSLPKPKIRQATKLAGVAVDESLPSLSLPEPKARQATQLVGVAVDASLRFPPEPKTRQATRLASIKVDTLPSAPEPRTCAPTQPAEVAVDALPSSPRQPKTRQATREAGIKVDSPPPSSPDIRTSRQGTRQGTKSGASVPSSPAPKNLQVAQQAGVKMDSSPPAPKNLQVAQQAGVKMDSSPPSPPTSEGHQPTRLAYEMEIVASPPSLPEPKNRQAKRALGIRDNASAPEPKTRRATRQAGIKINPPPPSLPDTRTSRQATARPVNNKKAEVQKIRDKHNENADLDEKPNGKQETSITIPPVNQESHENVKKDDFKADEKPKQHNILPPTTPEENYKENGKGPALIPPPKVQAPPTVVPTVNFGKQELLMFNPTVNNPIPQEGFGGDSIKPESSMSFSMNDLWTDPCIEFAVKTLTGAIPFADLNKVNTFSPSPLEVPLEELWTDPCIEFAVKTLTGAIPVGESDYLQHRPASSSNPRAQHDFSLPDMGMSFCQTEVLSKHYETGQNKQQESVTPTLGTGGLQKSGNIVNGSNDQCSRSRFFH